MNDTPENSTEEHRGNLQRRRRRLLLWALGLTVLLLLAIMVSQQLWLWTVIKPDTASRSVRAIDPQLCCFCCLLFRLCSQPVEAATRATRASARVESKDSSTRLLHLNQLFTDYRDGGVFLPVSQSLP
jgi:hypothetical protein